MLDLRYVDVERALAHAFRIHDEDLKAFRARIRHLRRRGVPDLPQTGSGRQLAYTVDHVRALYIGLRLNQAGYAPEAIGELLRNPCGDVTAWFDRVVERPDLPFFAAVGINAFGSGLGERNTFFGLTGYDIDRQAQNGFFDLFKQFKPGLVPLMVINVTEAENVIQDSLRAVGLIDVEN